jgi:CRP/FNR family cyclic AMP-dependent transcriptional regulator
MIRTFSIKKGEIIFREGSSSDFAYIIESGKFKVSKIFEDGKIRVISILKTNDIFGEMGVLEEMPRSATVTALENSRVTVLDKKDFDSLAESNPHALMPVLKLLSNRLRKTLRLASIYTKGEKFPAQSEPV